MRKSRFTGDDYGPTSITLHIEGAAATHVPCIAAPAAGQSPTCSESHERNFLGGTIDSYGPTGFAAHVDVYRSIRLV